MEIETIKKVAQQLEKKFGGETTVFRGDVQVLVPAAQIVAAARYLRDEENFEIMPDITAVDYYPQLSPRIHLVYQFTSVSRNIRITLRVPLEGDHLTLDTMIPVYPNANWLERELWDMFGIQFEGHPDLRRILMPHDWEGHPLRKDYPLGYEEVQFTFNYDEIDARKPRPKE
ncbi:MAG: NADH-quinone oxidoreductase subunit C [Anaerolineales bacterium]